MKKIKIDIRMLKTSGIGTYLINLIPNIIKAYPETSFHLIGKKDEIRCYDWANNDNVTVENCQAPIYSISEQFLLAQKKPTDTDLFWVPHYNIPLLYSGKLLVTVHDVFHIAMPEYMEGIHQRIYAKTLFTAVKYKAAKIICNSEFTAGELVRLTGVNPAKITVTHLGVSKHWFEIKKEKCPHNKPYLLYVGNVKPHKNLVTLVEAFELLANKIPHDLVIVGKKEGFITNDKVVEKQAASLKQRVHFTGYVDDEMLHQYFVHADALVFPSLYEGFGLPPLEAMACGCPVIVSNAASLPEVCGDAAIYCEPRDPTDIASKIEQLVKDKTLQNTMRQKGLERAKQFNWDKTVQQTLTIIEELKS
ncbi:MAG: glycosyltransferase family 1 protein [Candidatus Parabeggiatoa sp. nov. 1]|nr:MAG: glycosyltransferase family 1 protein [Gammaproteobacteria bacterium]